MRNYLFRGWSHNLQKWLYGILDVSPTGVPCILSKECRWWFEVREDTVGQLVEINKKIVKDNKSIFDGDYVLITDYTLEETFEECGEIVSSLVTRKYEVFWNKMKWSIKLVDPLMNIAPTIFDLPLDNVSYELVGNKFIV